MMVLILTILFVILTIVVFLPDTFYQKITIGGYRVPPEYWLFAICLILIIIAGFRGEGLDRDYFNYVAWFSDSKNEWPRSIEPSFILISRLVWSVFGDNILPLFVIYATLGVGIKILAIKEMTELWGLSVIMYLSYLFVLQDFTQIRAGVSTGIIMLSLKPLFERKALRFIVLIFLASLFHYSAIIGFILWFVNVKRIDKLLYLLLIPTGYFLFYFSVIDFALIEKLAFIEPLKIKILAYQNENREYINILNVWQLMRIVLSVIFILKADTISLYNKYAIILTKIYVLSTFFYVVLAFNPSFSTRISDLFAISDIILIPTLVYIIKPVPIGKILSVCIAFSYLFLNLFYNKLIQ